jgi:hypothetical protein
MTDPDRILFAVAVCMGGELAVVFVVLRIVARAKLN